MVIGILIALQINTWNENRKALETEIKLLKELRLDLIASKQGILDGLSETDELLKQRLELWEYIEKDLAYDSILDTHFKQLRNHASRMLITSTYITLTNRGMELIRNDSLRKMIVTLYNVQEPSTIGDYKRVEENLAIAATESFYLNHIESDIYDNTKAHPNDFEALKDNVKFKNLLSLNIRLKRYGLEQFQRMLSKLEIVIGFIDKELNRIQI